MKRIPEWVVIVVFVVAVVISNAVSTFALIKAVEDTGRALACLELTEEDPRVGPAGAAKACGLEE